MRLKLFTLLSFRDKEIRILQMNLQIHASQWDPPQQEIYEIQDLWPPWSVSSSASEKIDRIFTRFSSSTLTACFIWCPCFSKQWWFYLNVFSCKFTVSEIMFLSSIFIFLAGGGRKDKSLWGVAQTLHWRHFCGHR